MSESGSRDYQWGLLYAERGIRNYLILPNVEYLIYIASISVRLHKWRSMCCSKVLLAKTWADERWCDVGPQLQPHMLSHKQYSEIEQ